jgi:hypothetical protein
MHKIYTTLIGVKFFEFNSRCNDNFSLYDLSLGDYDPEIECDIQDIEYNFGQSFEQDYIDHLLYFENGDGGFYSRLMTIEETNA